MTVVELREIEVAVSRGHAVPAVLALPPAEQPWAANLVLHELWGPNDDIREIARRLAGESYVALARMQRPIAAVGYRPEEAEDAWRRISHALP